MPRITKKMKMEEIKKTEERLSKTVLMALGYGINGTNNIVDENGTRLMFGRSDPQKFLKWGDGPFRYREEKFDPVNNYQLMVQLFSNFMELITAEAEETCDENQISYIRTVVLKDGEINAEGKMSKYVEVDTNIGRIESERFLCPTLGYIEIILGQIGLLPMNEEKLRRLDELKNEMES